MEADGEALSIKSSGSVVRFNTFKDSMASVNIRHGAHNSLIGNTAIGMAVISVHGDNHQVIGNVLENTGLIIRDGDTTQTAMQDGGAGHPAARNTLVAYNKVSGQLVQRPMPAYIGVGMRIPGGNAASGVPASNTTLANNSGDIQYGQHTDTQAGTYDGAHVQVVALTPAEVGPAAPDVLCPAAPQPPDTGGRSVAK